MTEATKERPIIFSGEMVRAILAGRKTMTRRAVKPQPAALRMGHPYSKKRYTPCPFGYPGERLWVRETWAAGYCSEDLSPSQFSKQFYIYENGGFWYKADNSRPKHQVTPIGRWRPSIYMPRWASRITLEITDIRVERLQDISEADAIAEGVEPNCAMIDHSNCSEDDHGGEWLRYPVDQWDTPAFSAKESFQSLWESINGAGSWDANPWVWVIEFKRIAP